MHRLDLENMVHRIHTEMVIMDDEIARLQNLIAGYKAEIAQKQETIKKIDSDIELSRVMGDSYHKKHVINNNFYISTIKTECEQEIQKIKLQNITEIKALQESFNNELEKLKSKEKDITDEKIKQLDERIYKMHTKIQNMTIMLNSRSYEYMKNQLYAKVPALEERCLALKKYILDRQSDRYERLTHNKFALASYVDNLELIDNAFRNERKSRIQHLDYLEKKYNDKFELLKSKHEKEIALLKTKLHDKKEKLKLSKKSINNLEYLNRVNKAVIDQQLQNLKLSTTVDKSVVVEDSENRRALENMFISKTELLQHRSAVLNQMREENMELKRRIGEVKHKIKFKSRYV